MHTNKWQGLNETLQALKVHEVAYVLCDTAKGQRRVLLALLVLQLRGAWNSTGICWHMSNLCGSMRTSPVLQPHFESWECYSGAVEFPVEGNMPEYTRHHKWEGKYAAARRALLQHCIEGLCTQLDTNVEYELLLLELEFNKRKEELNNA